MKRWGVAGALCVVLSPVMAAWQDDARQIWDSGFKQKRPPASAATTRREPAPPSDRATRATGASSQESWVIGFTIWRLAVATTADTAPRLLVQDQADVSPIAYVPQRMPAGARLRVADRIRLGIEVARDGYLYVIDRERFADGTFGPPQLIFPARNLRGADNRVAPGRLIEIPGQSDRVPALRVQRADARSIGDELLLLVTSTPIVDLDVGSRETPLSEAQVRAWEQRFGTDAGRLDLAAASTWTSAEQQAGVSARLLTQDDPLPSSFYHVNADRAGVLLRIPLTIE
jgi:hypothetical protein